MKHYEVLQNLPGGIKKGDIVNTEKTRAGETTKTADGKLLPYNPVDEPTFFKEIVPVKSAFSKNQLVMLTEKVRVPKPKSNTSGRRVRTEYTTVPPWEELRIEKIFEHKDPKNTVIKYTVYHPDTNQTFDVSERELMLYHKYYFISSGGVLQSTVTGRDKRADSFRKLIGNYSENVEVIRILLKQIDAGYTKLKEV